MMDLKHYAHKGQSEDMQRPLVLVVDDNQDNLDLLTQLLELNQSAFITATNGETAIFMAQNYQPDLILLDMMLPDLSGLEVVNYLKQNPQTMQIPVIAVTAMARTEDQESFLAAGCIDCITKPYIIEEMEEIIRSYVSSSD